MTNLAGAKAAILQLRSIRFEEDIGVEVFELVIDETDSSGHLGRTFSRDFREGASSGSVCGGAIGANEIKRLIAR